MTTSRRRFRWNQRLAKENGDENLAIFCQYNKGKAKGINKSKGKSEESTSQPRKDWSKSSALFVISIVVMHYSV